MGIVEKWLAIVVPAEMVEMLEIIDRIEIIEDGHVYFAV